MPDKISEPFAPEKARRVIPRWLPPAVAPEVGRSSQGGQARRVEPFAKSRLATSVRRYNEAARSEDAIAAVLTARIYGLGESALPPKLLRAARDLWRPDDLTKHFVPDISRPFLPRPSKERALSEMAVAHCRQKLRTYPGNPIVLVELARHHAVLGNDEKARSALWRARSLAPDDVYLARAHNRLLLHLGDIGEALGALRSVNNWKANPWLLSAEIATSTISGLTSTVIGTGRKLAENGGWSPTAASELETAIATEEMLSGRRKRMQKLLTSSLRDPTGNALAQACFVARDIPDFQPKSSAWNELADPEALVVFNRSLMKWAPIIPAALHWAKSEPYSARPCLIGWAASNMAGDHDQALQFCNQGEDRSDGATFWANRRALSYAYSGRTKQAIEELESVVKQVIKSDHFLLATVGLVAYRIGASQFGDRCYYAAAMGYKDDGDLESVASALLYWGHETLNITRSLPDQERKQIATKIQHQYISDSPELVQMKMMLVDNTILHSGTYPPHDEGMLLHRLITLANRFATFTKHPMPEPTETHVGMNAREKLLE